MSTSGGSFPAWRRDGKELYYLDPSGAMMAAPVSVVGSAFESGATVRLFPTRVPNVLDVGAGRPCDVGPDGRFLVITSLDIASPITLLMNWQGGLFASGK